MPSYLVDLIVSDAKLSADVPASRMVEALRKARPDPGHIEVWRSDTDSRFWRIVMQKDAPTLAEALAGAEDVVKDIRSRLGLQEGEPLGVHVDIRDTGMSVVDTEPPPGAPYL
jgi:hypothetical protein